MKIVTQFLLGAVAALAPISLAAAEDFQLWTAVSASGSVEKDSRFLIQFDGQARFRDDASDLGVSILRPGLGWRVNRHLSLWTGYARVVSRPETGAATKENRLWQQASYSIGEALGGKITGRFRLEQRFQNTGADTGWRARQMLRYTRPLASTPLSAVLSNETFIALNDTDWGAASGYDQSRNFVGVNVKASDSLAIEGGYMLNHINRENAADIFNHVVSVSLKISF